MWVLLRLQKKTKSDLPTYEIWQEVVCDFLDEADCHTLVTLGMS